MTHDLTVVPQFFAVEGRQLLAKGYLIIPIKPGEKRPALASWQRARITATDIPQYANHGVGILCGQGAHPIVGVDIDISHPEIVQLVSDWCRDNLGVGCERVGAAPRLLIVYRAAEAGWTKGNSITFFDPNDPLKPNGKKNDQRVEVLGYGQQFVAYHMHPDTKKPYEWVDFFGGLTEFLASELPTVTESQIEALLAYVDKVVRERDSLEVISRGDELAKRGAGVDDDWLATVTQKTETSLAEASEYLSYIDNSLGLDYDMWLKVGMALHHEFDGSGDAFSLWCDWSSNSSKHDYDTCKFKWASFGKFTGSPTTLRWVIKMAEQEKADQDIEKRRENIDQIRQLITEASDSTELTAVIAPRVRELLGDDMAIMRPEVIGIFQQKFKALAGVNLPVQEARKLLLDRQPTALKKRGLTEFGNAERLLDKFGEGLMYVPELESWFTWTGVYWRKATHSVIEHLAKETVRSLAHEVDDHPDREKFYHFCAISQQARMVSSIVKLASSDPRVCVPASELDKLTHLLGVQNGVVDVRRGRLLQPDPKYRITRIAGCDYNPHATCPIFDQVLRDVFFNDQDMIDYQQRLIGYASLGLVSENIMTIWHGNGANGKSTVINAIRRAFGDYAKMADSGTFLSDGRYGSNAGGPREDLLRLRGARLVVVNEPDEAGELREGVVKTMTGGEMIPARGVHARESLEFEPTWLVVMPTNHKPIIKGTDKGIWRRLVLVPFSRDFDADKTIPKDPDMPEKLKAETEGILAWIVRGAQRYLTEGLCQPAAVTAARDAYREQMDLLAEWLDTCCDVGSGYSDTSKNIWASWQLFAESNGSVGYIRSSNALGRKLDSRFPAGKNASGTRVRFGIRVRPWSDELSDFFDES